MTQRQKLNKKLLDVAIVELKGRWLADQGRQNPAVCWQVPHAVRASSDILRRLFSMAGFGHASDSSGLTQASFFRLPVDSVGESIYLQKYFGVCESTGTDLCLQPGVLPGS